MRRYSGAIQTFLTELATVPREEIKFARVRDIIGPNAFFVDQSGTFTRKFTDYPADAMAARIQAAEKVVALAKEDDPIACTVCRTSVTFRCSFGFRTRSLTNHDAMRPVPLLWED